jgi:branched-chain amino acid transport system substrate-binding protein
MNKIHIKLWVPGSLIFLVCLLLLPGCSRPGTIKIGAIISTESTFGPVAEGVEVMEGLALAVEEINEHGGINGRKLELIHENPALDPENAKRIFREMEAAHRPLLYLSTQSVISLALAPLAEASSVVLVGFLTTAPEFTHDNEWVFRFWPTAETEASVIVPLLQKLGITRLGVLYLNDAFGQSIFREIENGLNAEGVRIQGVSFEVAENDFTGQVASLLANEAVCFIGFHVHLKAIAKELEEQGYAGVKIAPNAAASPVVRTIASAQGIYVIAPVVYNPDYLFARDFKRKYEQRYHKPFGHYSPCGYDLLKLLADLLEDRDIDRSTVQQVMASGFTYSGVFGELHGRPGEHDIHIPFFAAKIVDGEVVYR